MLLKTLTDTTFAISVSAFRDTGCAGCNGMLHFVASPMSASSKFNLQLATDQFCHLYSQAYCGDTLGPQGL